MDKAFIGQLIRLFIGELYRTGQLSSQQKMDIEFKLGDCGL